MTLLQLISEMEQLAAKQPAINAIVRNSILDLNKVPTNKYGTFVWTEGVHSMTVNNDMQSFAFTLFYVDRLNESHGNLAEIHSVGVDVLGNIVRTLAEDYGISTWTLTPFEQRFVDDCAGVYASVTIQVPLGTACPEIFSDSGNLLTSEGWALAGVNGTYILVRE